MGWWQVIRATAKRIPWGSVLTFGAEKWIEWRRRPKDDARATDNDNQPAADPPADTEGR